MIRSWGHAVEPLSCSCSLREVPLAPRYAFSKLVLLAASLGALTLHAQTRILVCESHDSACTRPNARFDTIWNFDGAQGTSTSPGTRDVAMVTIETFTGDTLIVRSSDPSGLTARYTGTVHGNKIVGNVQWSWPGHPDYPGNGIFTAVIQNQPASSTPSR